MKQIVTVFLLGAMCLHASGQNKTYPFEVKISGQGKPSIIFIPGFASSGEVWNDTKAGYEKDHTCYTLTMAGFAGITAQPGATFTNWETGIAGYIKENNIKNPVLIGHSMGGGLALAIAADYPELVKTIIVVDALPCLPALNNPAFKAADKPDCSAITGQITAASDEQFSQIQKMSIARLVTDTSKQILVAGWGLKSDRKTFAEMYCDFSNTDLREKIKNITCPALILLEADFKTIKPAIADQYKNLKTATLQYADKGQHFIMYDDKDWYLKQLNDFIN
ncbi:MAG: alpha/beta hydrolase [Ferruginibacter sp.]